MAIYLICAWCFSVYCFDMRDNIIRHDYLNARKDLRYHTIKPSRRHRLFFPQCAGIKRHYENTPIQIHWKFYHKKNGNFWIKNSDIFHISARNIDCGYSLEPPQRGGSNEYPQSMFLSRNKKNNVYPCKPQFYYIKVGFKGVKII